MVIIVYEVFLTNRTMLEGGIIEASNNILLFEKYKVTDIIYESDTVTIYVAEHIFMATKRVIKKILKKSIRQDSFYAEVKVLKNIRHPNIPIIYDAMEDSFAYYIIEDYMQGEHLDSYISRVGLLPEEKVVDIGIKICQIVSYLHCQKPIPVLFLDIHPKNILISNNEIFLVDFGSSYYESETEKREWLLGTAGYAAPEQYVHGSLDVRADIYGIGAVLYFLITGRSDDGDTLSLQFPKHISEKLKMIVAQCVAKDRGLRFQSVDTLLANLMELKLSDNVRFMDERPHIISFVGGTKRVGVTHISLRFAKYLADNGYKVVYEEANESNHLRMMARYEKLSYDSGFFGRGKLLLKPAYGPQIQLQADCDIVVLDFGDCSQLDSSSYNGVLIVGGKPWELDESARVCEMIKSKIILCNGISKAAAGKLWKSLGRTGMVVPYLQEPFAENDMDKEFFDQLARALGIDSKGGVKHRKKARIFERIAGKEKDSHSRYTGSK